MIKLSRDEKNNRIFDEKDIVKITNIVTLTQEIGMNLVGVKVVFALAKKFKMSDDEVWDFIQDHKSDFF